MSRKKKKKKKRKKHGSIHHILPQSKGGPKESWNEIEKNIEMHQAFHTLFENKLPCLAIHKINEKWTQKSRSLKRNRMTEKQKMAWDFLFHTSPKKAIILIKKYWTLKQCFRFKQCFNNKPRKKCPVIKLYKEGKLNSLF